jgi:hypothetical protein
MPGLIYLIQPPQCVGTNCYKIGMSNSNTIRIRDYGSGCINIVSRECGNPLVVEKELIAVFTERFGSSVKGKEWFNGSKLDMINSYDECFSKYATFVEENVGGYQSDAIYSKQITICEFVANHLKLTRDRPAIVIDRRMYELFDILPDGWFLQTDLLETVINTIRNEPVIQENRISTIRELMLERNAYVDEWLLIRAFQSKMTGTHKKDTLVRMKEIILRTSAPMFNRWQARFNKKQVSAKLLAAINPNISYRRGAIAKFRDLQANVSQLDLLAINPEWITSLRRTCVECSQIHFQDCRSECSPHLNDCVCNSDTWGKCDPPIWSRSHRYDDFHVWGKFTYIHNIEIRNNGPPPPLFRYRRGYCVKLSDLKLVQPDISEIKLLTMNPEWTASRKAICIHCKQYHARQCCPDYDASAKATCIVVDNITLLC